MADPIPQVRRVTQLDRIESRGATVIYRKPKWKEAEGPRTVVKQAFVYPADRSAGSGQTKIRRRREKIYRAVKYTLP